MKSYAVLAAMVLLAGCGDDDGNSLSEYEGIWEVQSHTENMMRASATATNDSKPSK